MLKDYPMGYHLVNLMVNQRDYLTVIQRDYHSENHLAKHWATR